MIQRLGDIEARALARRIVTNEVYTSNHIPHAERVRILPSVFMVLMFMEAEELEGCGMLYAPMSSAGPIGVNGYPCFFEATMVHLDDISLLNEHVTRMQEALN